MSAAAEAVCAELPFDALDLGPDEVRNRFARARRRGQPAWLWPELTAGEWRRALAEIEAVTRGVLSGDRGVPRLEGPPEALGIAAYTSGMGPLLGYWIETGRVAAEDDAGALLRLHLRHNRERMRRLLRTTEDAVTALGEAGVSPLVLKGMHTAVGYFPEPGTRPLADVDLFVAPSELAAAAGALRKAGYLAGRLQRRPYKCEWTAPSFSGALRSLSLTHADDPFSLDVHASLDRNFFGVGTVRLDRLLASSDSGAWTPAPSARVLRQPLLTLLLAAHASEGLHALSLIRLVELTMVIRRDAGSGELRWDELLDAAERAGALRFSMPAFELCSRLLPGSVPAPVLARFRAAATPAMVRVLGRLSPAGAQRLDGLSVEERLMWAGTPWERVRRAGHAVWPAPAGGSLAALGGIYGVRLWRVVRGRVGR